MGTFWIVASIAGYGECAFAADSEHPVIEGRVKGGKLTMIFKHPGGAFAFVRANEGGVFDFPLSGVSAFMPVTDKAWLDGLEKCWSAIVTR